MTQFDRPGTLEKLDALPRFARVAFAAACAERQMASYAQMTTNLDAFRSVSSANCSLCRIEIPASSSDDVADVRSWTRGS